MTDRAGGWRELVAGLVLLGASAAPSGRRPLPAWELEWFKAVNDLPDRLYRPVWAVMQLGALGAAPATAAVAFAAGDRRLAGRLLGGGAAAWATAKVVKRVVRRARPPALVAGARVRGRTALGDGYPSGHAAVATALAAAALSSVNPELRPLLAGLAVTVAAARVYVGAHLPLDVVGGASLGLTVDGAARLYRGRARVGRA